MSVASLKKNMSIRFKYNDKKVVGTVDSFRTVDGNRISPENRGQTLVVVRLEIESDDYDSFSRKPAQFKSYYFHKIQEWI